MFVVVYLFNFEIERVKTNFWTCLEVDSWHTRGTGGRRFGNGGPSIDLNETSQP